MRKRNFSEHRIIKVLERAEASVAVKDLCWEFGISSGVGGTTCCQWRSSIGYLETIKVLTPGKDARPFSIG